MSNLAILGAFHHPVLGPFKNRVVMAPMTRSFATADHLCTPKIVDYYERRAKGGVGLIITEGIIVHPSADGYNSVPYLHDRDQMLSWKPVVEAVHKHQTKIYAQLWHCGRISHPDYTNGYDVVSSTSIAAAGLNRQNNKSFGVPRALLAEEMPAIYKMFSDSAQLAIDAGFDGVELHMGHGYLVDQFLDARINDRSDAYGGSIANRCRFAFELLQAVIDRIGVEKVMVRISPSRFMGGLYEWPDLYEMLDELVMGFNKRGLLQLDISCANANYYETSGKIIRYIRPKWPHLIVGGASLAIDSAEEEYKSGLLDFVTWGRAIIANPDFVERIHQGVDLKVFDDRMRESLI